MGTGAKVAIALVGVAILAGVGYWIYTMQKPKDTAPTGGGKASGNSSGTGTGVSGSNTLDITPLDEQKPTCPSGMSMVAGKCQCPTGTMPSANGCIPCPIIGGVVKCPR